MIWIVLMGKLSGNPYAGRRARLAWKRQKYSSAAYGFGDICEAKRASA